MKEVRLENWAVVYADPYRAPEVQKPCLGGQVFGHPRFEDGERVTSTSIQGLDGEVVLTRNTRYVLGQVDPQYEVLYPDARNRLFKSWKNQLGN